MKTITLCSASRVSINVYWLVTGLFGLAYGIYGYYVFIYLSRLQPEGPSLIQPLLPILAATMLFEFFAEPVTGRFADVYGRRIAVVMAFLTISAAFIVYSAAALPSISDHQWRVQAIAIGAELILAIGLALHSGSFDAWVVERVYEAEGSRDISTETIFARAGQIFTVGLTLGGFIGSFAVGQTSISRDITANVWPWLLSAFLALLAVLVGAAAMYDRPNVRAPDWSEGRTVARFLLDSAKRVLALRNQPVVIKRTIYVNSAIYAIGIVFIYFSTLVAERVLRPFGLVHLLYVIPFLYVVPRLLGPQLAILATRRFTHGDDDAYRILFRSTGVACAVSAIILAVCASLLMTSAERLPQNATLYLVIGSVAFFSTSLFVHMLKPVTTAYLNYHIKDDTNRAFINSMSNPAGGLVVAFVCIALILTNDSARAPNTSDVLLIFLIPAILALVAIVLATSAKKEAKNA